MSLYWMGLRIGYWREYEVVKHRLEILKIGLMISEAFTSSMQCVPAWLSYRYIVPSTAV